MTCDEGEEMIDFSVNLSTQFADLPFLKRFAVAAAAGFEAVELSFPYDHAKEEIAEELRRHRLKLVLFNLPAGDGEQGERGIACQPDRIGEFQAGVDRAIEYASALGCRYLNCLAGVAPPDVPEPVLRRTFIDNLRFVTTKLMRVGMRLLIEPKNIRNDYLRCADQAVAIMNEVSARNLSLKYSVCHMLVTGEPSRAIARFLPRIAHIHIGDLSDRGGPTPADVVDCDGLLSFVDEIGYRGWIGCECTPQSRAEPDLCRLRRHGLGAVKHAVSYAAVSAGRHSLMGTGVTV
jgi:hydroxypyruvate isomerase